MEQLACKIAQMDSMMMEHLFARSAQQNVKHAQDPRIALSVTYQQTANLKISSKDGAIVNVLTLSMPTLHSFVLNVIKTARLA